MAQFDIMVRAPKAIMEAGDDIHNRYFTIDTADLITFYEWYEFNPHIVTYACIDDEVIGYFNVIPITTECGQLFDQQAIKEEDMQVKDILPIEATPHAQYAYLASIAIKDRDSYISKQCTAALLASITDQLLNGFNIDNMKRIYANPTTFYGNKLVRKLGMKPVVSHKKPLKGNDIYALDITPETIAGLRAISARYRRFIKSSAWLGTAAL